jgi:hypothetical protein
MATRQGLTTLRASDHLLALYIGHSLNGGNFGMRWSEYDAARHEFILLFVK